MGSAFLYWDVGGCSHKSFWVCGGVSENFSEGLFYFSMCVIVHGTVLTNPKSLL